MGQKQFGCCKLQESASPDLVPTQGQNKPKETQNKPQKRVTPEITLTVDPPPTYTTPFPSPDSTPNTSPPKTPTVSD